MWKIKLEKWEETKEGTAKVLAVENLINEYMIKDMWMSEEEALIYIFTQMINKMKMEDTIKELGF